MPSGDAYADIPPDLTRDIDLFTAADLLVLEYRLRELSERR
jgi:hypothetical protein